MLEQPIKNIIIELALHPNLPNVHLFYEKIKIVKSYYKLNKRAFTYLQLKLLMIMNGISMIQPIRFRIVSAIRNEFIDLRISFSLIQT